MEHISDPTPSAAQPEVSHGGAGGHISAHHLGAPPAEGARAAMLAAAFDQEGLFAESGASSSATGELVPESTREPTLRHYAVQVALILPWGMDEIVAALTRFEFVVTVFSAIGVEPSRTAEDIRRNW